MEGWREVVQAGAGRQEKPHCGAGETHWEAACQGTPVAHWEASWGQRTSLSGCPPHP